MFTRLLCEPTLLDKIITIIVLYSLYIADLTLTFINLHRLKILYPRKYMFYERNVVIKYMEKKIGLTKTSILYPLIIGLPMFSLLAFYVVQPPLLIGIFVSIVFLIHIPNYIEIKKRLEKRLKK